mgnify:CR=1 FL=1
MPANLTDHLSSALEARRALMAQLHAEQTNAYRLFHGSVEGESGLSVDRYGDALLVQTFHRPLPPEALAALEAFYAPAFPGLPVFYNDRSQSNSRISNALAPEQIAAAHGGRVTFGQNVPNGAKATVWLPLDQKAPVAFGQNVVK